MILCVMWKDARYRVDEVLLCWSAGGAADEL